MASNLQHHQARERAVNGDMHEQVLNWQVLDFCNGLHEIDRY